MKDPIKCPNCGEVIELSEAISHDIEIRIKKDMRERLKRHGRL